MLQERPIEYVLKEKCSNTSFKYVIYKPIQAKFWFQLIVLVKLKTHCLNWHKCNTKTSNTYYYSQRQLLRVTNSR